MPSYIKLFFSTNNETLNISIYNFIESNSDEIREKYINIIDTISNKNHNEKKLFNYFKFENTSNLWWLSSIYEKSFYKSKNITNLYKIIAIDIIIKTKKPNKILFYNEDYDTRAALKELCSNYSVSSEYVNRNLFKNNKSESFRFKIKKIIPDYLISINFLILFFFKNYRFRKVRKPNWIKEKSILILSYFNHVSIKSNLYESIQWTDLPSLISSKDIKINWLHYGAFKPKTNLDDNIFKVLNCSNKSNLENHYFLENYNSISLSLSILIKYFKIRFKLKSISLPQNFFNTPLLNTNIWTLIRDDWFSSFTGVGLMQNLILDKLIKIAINDIQPQKLILYPLENQGWERSLLINTERENLERVGYVHSSIRYWDTRYFDSYKNIKSFSPKPDKIAVHSSSDIADLIKLSFPIHKIYKVEALRYMKTINSIKPLKIFSERKPIRQILLLGDFQYKLNYRLLNILEKIYSKKDNKYFTFKSHPSFPIKIDKNINININFDQRPINQIIYNYDAVIAVDASGSAIDSLLLGSNLIIFTDKNNINFSPLRNIPNIIFVDNANDLKLCLDRKNSKYTNDNFSHSYYNDVELTRWNKLISQFEYF